MTTTIEFKKINANLWTAYDAHGHQYKIRVRGDKFALVINGVELPALYDSVEQADAAANRRRLRRVRYN